MFDYKKLKMKLIEKDKSVEDLASLLNKSKQSIYSRLNGDIPFRDTEIVKISKYLNIEPVEINDYFFKVNVHK